MRVFTALYRQKDKKTLGSPFKFTSLRVTGNFALINQIEIVDKKIAHDKREKLS